MLALLVVFVFHLVNLHNYCYLSSVHAVCLSFRLLAQTVLNRDSGSCVWCFIYIYVYLFYLCFFLLNGGFTNLIFL